MITGSPVVGQFVLVPMFPAYAKGRRVRGFPARVCRTVRGSRFATVRLTGRRFAPEYRVAFAEPAVADGIA